MAIIIDTNCFANVFNRKSVNHTEFIPVLEWIIKGKGIIVYGGTKYVSELRKTTKYLRILRLLKEVNKVHTGDLENIDRLQSIIEKKIVDDDFDDPHLPAIIIETKCKLICSEDKRSISFVKNKALYPNGYDVPLYYTGSRNLNLLCDNNIHSDLKPLCKLKKVDLNYVEKFLGNI